MSKSPKTMRDHQAVIMRSKIYRSGGSFVLSDVVSKLHLCAKHSQRVLDRMVFLGMLDVEEFGHHKAYRKGMIKTPVTTRRLANYTPPKPAGMTHINPWMAGSMGQERGANVS